MKGGAQMASLVHRVISRTDTVGSKRSWIRGLSQQNSFSVSAVPPELLQLPTSHTNTALMRKQRKLRRASLNSRLRLLRELSPDRRKSFVGPA
jgi:hypothetical protein